MSALVVHSTHEASHARRGSKIGELVLHNARKTDKLERGNER